MDALDLRAFLGGPRTWVRQLSYQRADTLLIFAGSTALSFMGIGRFWMPEVLLRLAART